MTLQDKPAFLLALKLLSAAFDKPLSQERLEAYWLVLESLPIDLVEQAMRDVAQTSQWMPAPAIVRQAAIARDVRARAGQGPAWVYVERATGREYHDEPPVGSHSEFTVRRRSA